MRKKKLSAKDFAQERKYFLEVFMKGTYRKSSLYERYGYGMFGTYGNGENAPTQPSVRKRFLAEEGYHGKYQPKSLHKARDEEDFDFIVIGRYFTRNLGHENYRIRVINLNTGRIAFRSVG